MLRSAILLLLLAGTVNFVGRAAKAEIITAQMRADDPALQKPVVPLLAPRIPLYVLLKQLSQETKVDITFHGSPRGPGETEVCALIRDAPLSDVMNGISALLSYKAAPWRWTREGTPGHYRYILWRSLKLDSLVDEIQQQIQDHFEAQIAACEMALKMSPEELRKAQETNTDIPSFSHVQFILNNSRGFLQTFFDCLSPEQRLRVLRGEPARILVPSSPDEKRIETTRPKPAYLSFQTEYLNDAITPDLFSNGSSCIGDGKNEADWRDRIADLWSAPEDRKTPDTAPGDQTIKRPDHPLPVPEEIQDDIDKETYSLAPLMGIFWKTSEAVPISILAIPPPRPRSGSATVTILGGSIYNSLKEPYGMTLNSLLGVLDAKPYYMSQFTFQHKWQGNILLMRDSIAPFRNRLIHPAPNTQILPAGESDM